MYRRELRHNIAHITKRIKDLAMANPITCFKAYDIRGELNSQLTEDVAYRIAYAFAEELDAKTVVVGSDVRLSSTPLKLALSAGFFDAGAKVTDIGMAGTEEINFATKNLGVDGGIEVTASHNPIDYNGMKRVKAGSIPISGDTGQNAIKERAEELSDKFVNGRLNHYVNSQPTDADAALERVTNKYQPLASVIDTTEGLGLEFDAWRFNLRKSNTEPVIRLNVESKGDIKLMEEKTTEVLKLLRDE